MCCHLGYYVSPFAFKTNKNIINSNKIINNNSINNRNKIINKTNKNIAKIKTNRTSKALAQTIKALTTEKNKTINNINCKPLTKLSTLPGPGASDGTCACPDIAIKIQKQYYNNQIFNKSTNKNIIHNSFLPYDFTLFQLLVTLDILEIQFESFNN